MKSAFEILPLIKNHVSREQRMFFRKYHSEFNDCDNKNYLPDTLELFLGGVCNLKCIYCFTEAGKETGEILTEKNYKNVIDQAFDMGVREVVFPGKGEPILYPVLWKLLQYVQVRGGKSVVLTNAASITPEIANKLYNSGCFLVTKINSFTSEIQDKLAGMDGAAHRMYRGLYNLMEAGFNKPGKTYQTRLINNNLLCALNYKEVTAILKWCISYNIRPFLERLQWTGRALKNINSIQLSSEQLNEVTRHLKLANKEGWRWPGEPYLDGEVCHMGKMPLFVNEKGDVVPCWMRENMTVGNIKDTSLENLWFDKHYIEIRQHHLNLKTQKSINGECPGRKHERELAEKKGIKVGKMQRKT